MSAANTFFQLGSGVALCRSRPVRASLTSDFCPLSSTRLSGFAANTFFTRSRQATNFPQIQRVFPATFPLPAGEGSGEGQFKNSIRAANTLFPRDGRLFHLPGKEHFRFLPSVLCPLSSIRAANPLLPSAVSRTLFHSP